MSWRPNDWDANRVAAQTYGYGALRHDLAERVGIAALESYEKILIEAGADAMHKADIEWLNQYLIERPATGKVRIILDIADWRTFTSKEISD